MKTVTLLLALAALPRLAHAEEVWRWTNANGTTCYTNRAEAAPVDAAPVRTRLVVETTRLPDPAGAVLDVGEERAVAPAEPKRPHRIYSEARRRFDCYAGGLLFSGGWAHADDIAGVGNCLPYLLGPEAWLNSARAELALREHGIDWREVVLMYVAQPRMAAESSYTSVGDRD